MHWDDYVQPLVYAYNNLVHRSTGTTPFEITLVRAPPPYIVVLQDTGIPQDVTGKMTSAQAKRYSRKRIDSKLKAPQTHFGKAQKRYKADFDKSICFVRKFSPGDYVYLDRPPKEKHLAEDIAAKLVPRSTGPYRVIKSTGHTVTIDRDGLQDILSTDRVSMAPRPSGGAIHHPTRSASVPQAIAGTSPRILTPPPPAQCALSTPVVDATLSRLPLPSGPTTSTAPPGIRAVTADRLGPQINKAGPQGAVAEDLAQQAAVRGLDHGERGRKTVSSEDGYGAFEDMY
ncbi:hypothetical protein BWQ96_01072 [Gracilariopsis chorda]|uniref:Integrase catalytic domain-containing protein n=1 Tax=Gracilariopsis chorda TaxID=448386 RepID=A0A2V3J488_9FLOR|nr:hypothetical protein BWQ96_01072 [Gracilariopsis chorda]|eukprot:PXF49123.1 hypothetical protein BWQ96_01072 [Gracilariopsis chorda]